jgi:hypothetical protein
MAKRRLISTVVHGPNGKHYTRVPIVDLALEHARSSVPGEIPTIVEVNAALRTGSGGAWLGQTWEACWLTADEYDEFRRRAQRREVQFRREQKKMEKKT